jgi:hypothetical protein
MLKNKSSLDTKISCLSQLKSLFSLFIQKKIKETLIFFNNFFVDEKNNSIFAVPKMGRKRKL